MFVVGARPQFIKLAPVWHAMQDVSGVRILLTHTGQHYDYQMSAQFFEELNIPEPDYHLNCGGGTAGDQYSKVIAALGLVLTQVRPDLLVVIGDTNSTGAAAVCAAIHQVRLAHIESGLREFDKTIPEEVNKMVTDTLSDLLLCPTQTAVDNLYRLGTTGKVVLTGDPGLDLVREWLSHYTTYSDERYGLPPELLARWERPMNAAFEHNFIYATSHREVNTRDRASMERILQIFTGTGQTVVWPVHPRSRKAIIEFGLGDYLSHPDLVVTEPVGFWTSQSLLKHCSLVITDSGGLIKEAYFHGKYVIIIDHQTEWVEVVNEGRGVVCGPDISHIKHTLLSIPVINTSGKSLGDGYSAQRIAKEIADFVFSP